MDKVLSDKIRVASLLCTFMVVVRHARNLQAFWGTEHVDNICAFIENGCSVLTEIAVPFFFLISGFFFFRYSYYPKGVYANMVKKKAKSLFLPFLFWNLVGLAVLWIIGGYINDNPLNEKQSFLDYALGFLLSDYYGPLWYVRNLIFMMALVPLYGWIFDVNNLWVYGIVLIPLLIWWYPVDCAWWSSEGWFFFIGGGVLWHYQKVLSVKFSVVIVIVMVCMWLMMCFVRWEWSVWMHKATTLLGVITFWQLLNYIQGKAFSICVSSSSFSFFIFVNHFYLVKGMKIFLAEMYPTDEKMAMVAYFLLPVITFLLLLSVGKLWQKMLPHTYSFCMGGRG